MNDQIIKQVLEKYKKIAVIGLSPRPNRPSFGVTQYMMSQGYETVGVRPGGLKDIMGRPVYEALKDVPGPLEIVDVFRANEFIPDVVDEVIAAGAKVLWLQLGVTHPAAEKKARDHGVTVISDRCILVEHRRLIR
jgi:uncharacterized protein